MAFIKEQDAVFSRHASLDPMGRLFRWRGKILRGIYPDHADAVRQLFASNCLEKLADRGLFPRSRLTEHVLEGFSLIVEHEEIPLVVYPYEWSFDMLQDAAVASLEVAEICAQHGWLLTDIHPLNVVFRAGRPVYVDLGSFRPLPPGKEGWKCQDYHRFVKAFWRPLSLWANGDSFLAHSILSSHEPYPDLSWWLYRHSMLRAISPHFSARWARRFDRWSRKGARFFSPVKLLETLPASLASRLPVELLTRSPSLLRQKISRLKQPLPTQWDNYHSPLFQEGKLTSNPRFDRLLEIIRSLNCESVTELAGNQGAFSLLIAARTPVRRILCTDYSSSPINDFYNRSLKMAPELNGRYLQGAVLDFMAPQLVAATEPPPERFKADTVIALAVLHHLILTQKFHPRQILTTIAQYTRRYAIVEFMPRGMWTEQKSQPTPPWYTVEWFRPYFVEVFDVIAVEQLEPNRIAFIGRLKTVSSDHHERRHAAQEAAATSEQLIPVAMCDLSTDGDYAPFQYAQEMPVKPGI